MILPNKLVSCFIRMSVVVSLYLFELKYVYEGSSKYGVYKLYTTPIYFI